MKRITTALIGIVALLALTACEDDATVASRNLSKAADQFQIARNIVFYNTWTDTEVVTVTGLCSIDPSGATLSVTCKEGSGLFKKHYMGKTANLSFFAVQLDSADVSTIHTKIIWKPTSFIPDIDLVVKEQ